MKTLFTAGVTGMALATLSLAPLDSAWAAGDCGWGSHATRTASTTVDTTTAPLPPADQPKSGG